MSDMLVKMFFGGFVRMHVLYHARREPVFGVEMMEELRRHGYDVGAGTLYPMLHQLEKAGYLAVQTEVVAGKTAEVLPGDSRGSGRAREGQGEAPRARFRGPGRQAADAVNTYQSLLGSRAQARIPDRKRGEAVNMLRDRVMLAVVALALLAALSGCEQAAPAAAAQTSARDLAARVKALEDLVPSQSHMMADVGDHFTNLWFAGTGGELAAGRLLPERDEVAPPLGRAADPDPQG